MAHLARSLTAMALVVLAAGLFVLADAFLVAAYAVVTPESAGTASGLGHAGLWLQFAAGIAALAAVCAACWGAGSAQPVAGRSRPHVPPDGPPDPAIIAAPGVEAAPVHAP